MANVHRFPSRNFRPDPAEFEPAKAALEAAGIDMNAFLRACLRLLVDDQAKALRVIGPHLPIRSDRTPKKSGSPTQTVPESATT